MDDGAYSQRDQGGGGDEPASTSGFDGFAASPLDLGADDFQLLKRALLNERMAPEVLAYKEQLVERVKSALQRQEADLELLERQKEADVARGIAGYEADRLRFLLKAYLRARLDKIQAHAGFILHEARVRARLSQAEQLFVQQVFVAAGRGLKASVLDHVPPAYASLVKRYDAESDNTLLVGPDTAGYVFAHVLDDCGQVPDGPDGQTAELRAGDMMVVKYSTVAALVEAGRVCLV
ncbi:GINS4 [Scenedesmus sp. PABB004]|nr:GINS4 [Scenedesmus sp. PABB004]